MPRSGDLSWGSIQPPWWEISQPSWNEDKLFAMLSVRMKPLPPPNGPRMAACLGRVGKAGWAAPRGHPTTQVLGAQFTRLHRGVAGSWGGI